MSQNAELEAVKRKIRNMLNFTISNGATEAEANSAMLKVGELLQQYQLSMEEIDVRAEKCIVQKVQSGTLKRSQNSMWVGSLARFCGVRTWFTKVHKVGYEWCFFGLESDVQMACYLTQMLLTAIKTETNQFKLTDQYRHSEVHRKRLSNSFVNGMNSRLAARLRDLTTKIMPVATSGTQALVVVAKADRIESEFKRTGVRLRTVPTATRTTSHSSAAAGAAAADRVNLNRPIAGKNDLLRIGRD